MTQTSISAAVLIGGHSRRMGAPKALLRLADGGQTLIERTVATLRRVASEVVLVGTPPWPLPDSLSGYRLVADRGTSAADGVIAALETATGRFCVVVACDMPFLDAAVLRAMVVSAAREGKGMIATDARGVHPLHGVWDRERLPTLRAAVDRGERSLVALTRIAGMVTIDLGSPNRDERERWSTFNVNTPEDLEEARRRASDVG